MKSDSDRSTLPAPPLEATETPRCLLRSTRGSPGLQSHSKEPAPGPGATARLLQGRAGLESLLAHSERGQASVTTLGTERSSPGMQHNLEDGMERGRSGLRQVLRGAGAEEPRGWAGCWHTPPAQELRGLTPSRAGLAAGTPPPSPGRAMHTFLSVSLAAQRLQPSCFCLEPQLDKICQLSTHKTHQHFPVVEVYSRTIALAWNE